MFAAGVKIATAFTRPVIISHRRVNGKCATGIGAFVVVNSQGWILTACHILEQILQLNKLVTDLKAVNTKREAIERDQALTSKQKRRQVDALGKVNPKTPSHYSVWWSWNSVNVAKYFALPDADVALIQLQPFDPTWVSQYPTFKDPTKAFDPGTSLCRLGYPFHEIEPVYDAAADRFDLPNGSVPPPLFPIEGILTRFVHVAGVQNPPSYPVTFLETSSPGLKGQSGGPIFDREGSVWGIQCKTNSYALGFTPEVSPGQKEHQFLNVGWGTHAETILGLLDQHGVNYSRSTY